MMPSYWKKCMLLILGILVCIKYCNQTEYVVQIGDNVSITCNQTGNGILWFKQYPNQRPILLDPKMKDHEHFNDGRLLTMKNIKLEDSATYYCGKRENTEYTFGNITYIKIKGMDQLNKRRHNSLQSATVGESLNLTCQMNSGDVVWYKQSGNGPPVALITMFYKTALPLPVYHNVFGDHSLKSFRLQDTSILNFRDITKDDNGTYYCTRRVQGNIHFENGTEVIVAVPDSSHRICSFYWSLLPSVIGSIYMSQ